jgi:hypothetical protein
MKTVLNSLIALVVLSVMTSTGEEGPRDHRWEVERFLKPASTQFSGRRDQVRTRFAVSFRDSRPVVRRTRLHAGGIAG